MAIDLLSKFVMNPALVLLVGLSSFGNPFQFNDSVEWRSSLSALLRIQLRKPGQGASESHFSLRYSTSCDWSPAKKCKMEFLILRSQDQEGDSNRSF